MKFNLYIPTVQEKNYWEKFAKLDHRSLSEFIRVAVREKIARMKAEIDAT